MRIPFAVLLAFIELRDRPVRTLKGSNRPTARNLGSWEKASPLPSWRYEFAATALGDEIFVIGGVWLPSVWFPTRLAEAYNTKTGTWRKVRPYPKLVHHTGAVSCGNELYIVGGNGIRIWPKSDVYAYQSKTDQWHKRASLPTARGALGVVAIGIRIYAVGGGINKIPVDVLEIYDTKTDRWQKGRPMPTPREHIAAAAADGKMFVLGGYQHVRFNNLTTNEAYDPKTDTWEARAPLPYAVSGFAAAAIDKSIFIFGGEQGWAVSPEVHEYVVTRDIWVRRKDLSVGRYALTATAVGRQIHVIGGNALLMGDDFRNDHDIFMP